MRKARSVLSSTANREYFLGSGSILSEYRFGWLKTEKCGRIRHTSSLRPLREAVETVVKVEVLK